MDVPFLFEGDNMYKNRTQAGEVLAAELACLPHEEVCLFAIPRGGVVVAQPIAHKLKIGIQLLITRKLSHPANPEVAIGAVMPDGSAIFDSRAAALGLSETEVDNLIASEYEELKRRQRQFAQPDTPPDIKGKSIILVDDGIATGYTLLAAVKWLQRSNPQKIILAVPVAPLDVLNDFSQTVKQIICPLKVEDLLAVSLYYEDFSQTTEEEVRQILRNH